MPKSASNHKYAFFLQCPEYETDEGHPGESDLIHNTPMTTHIKQEVIDDDLQYETTEYDPMEDMSHEGFLSHEDQKLKLDYRHEALLSKSSKRISPTANNKTRRRPRKDKLLDVSCSYQQDKIFWFYYKLYLF